MAKQAQLVRKSICWVIGQIVYLADGFGCRRSTSEPFGRWRARHTGMTNTSFKTLGTAPSGSFRVIPLFRPSPTWSQAAGRREQTGADQPGNFPRSNGTHHRSQTWAGCFRTRGTPSVATPQSRFQIHNPANTPICLSESKVLG